MSLTSVLGFGGVQPAATGRPAYHPAAMLKIYVYGYLNRVQSARRLEREAQRNIEVMWLTGAWRRTSRPSPTSAGTTARRSGLFAAGSSWFAGGRSLFTATRCHRRQQIQGGQHPRQQFHANQGSQAAGTARGEHRPEVSGFVAIGLIPVFSQKEKQSPPFFCSRRKRFSVYFIKMFAGVTNIKHGFELVSGLMID